MWLHIAIHIRGKEATVTVSTRLWLIVTSHLISSTRSTPYVFAPWQLAL